MSFGCPKYDSRNCPSRDGSALCYAARIVKPGETMKRGLYRTFDPFLGECAKVHKSAGDAAPFLIREIYEFVHFEPDFDDLPMQPDDTEADEVV